MTCYRPVSLGKPRVLKFDDLGHAVLQKVPCGTCLGCRSDYARDWTVRCMNEFQLHDSSYFVTLTYDDEHLPFNHLEPSLCPPHVVKFFKRLRKHQSVRFFLCGEYGERTGRPHYHAIIFGLELTDLVFHSQRNGNTLYRSEFLTSVWKLGDVVVGAVTPESISYTAGYCLKKLIRPSRQEWIDRGQFPEFVRMSRRPGIGKDWFFRFRKEVVANDSVTVSGLKSRVPRYYDKLAANFRVPLEIPIEQIKAARIERANLRLADSTPDRLKIREAIAFARRSRRPPSVH